MREFFFKVLVLVLLILFSYAAVYLFLPPRLSYLTTTADKHKRLQQEPPPRVIFVGGSNLAFGLDSELIEKSLGLRPVNMGLAAGLGLRFMLDEVKPSLQPGDTVVISPEYELFARTVNGERDLSEIALIDLKNLRYFTSLEQYLVLFKNAPLYFQDRMDIYLFEPFHGATHTSEIYRRDAFNQYGDITSHLGLSPRTDWHAKFFNEGINPTFDETSNSNFNEEALKIINEFYEYAQGKGARVFLSFPCVPDTLNARDKRYIEALYRYLLANSKVPIADAPQTCFYPLDCFFDTYNHLIAECRERRTGQVIDQLKRFSK